ncbi:hypothetical protein SADUNF_Sadunf14G0031100 [Salix dunnii]|uniref:BZIP domain-containing protein n=1 Tax=Salix dunnii TaxID=1413687 RepID=A0A835JHD1_9ROSI|nr:hypothetical protein SADUNF_Sadunf14G0031100 [Salix dunnii]
MVSSLCDISLSILQMELHDLSEATTSELGWKNARKRRICMWPAQPERPSPTGEEDEEEEKGPDHLAEKGKKADARARWAKWPRFHQRFEKTKTIDKFLDLLLLSRNITKPAQDLLLLSVSRPTDSKPSFEAGSCVSTNEEAVYCEPSYEQDGQTVQPLVTEQSDQNVTPSADEIKKVRKWATNKKTYRDRKKRKTGYIKRQLEKVRADIDMLNNTIACLNGKLDQMRRDREALRRQPQTVEEQNTMINMLMPLLLPETTGFDTRETGLPVHHPPINQSGATMEPGSPVIEE